MTAWFTTGAAFGAWQLILAGLVFGGLILWAVRGRIAPRRHRRTPGVESRKALLDRRFERGEIDLASYLSEREALLPTRRDRH